MSWHPVRWLIGAAAVAGMALLPATSSLALRQDPATASAPREIPVVAKRFAFDPARIEVAAGEKVRLLVTSADAVHGLRIRKAGVNKLIQPGSEPTVIEFAAPEAGTYPIVCSEACGEGHADMTGSLVVVARGK